MFTENQQNPQQLFDEVISLLGSKLGWSNDIENSKYFGSPELLRVMSSHMQHFVTLDESMASVQAIHSYHFDDYSSNAKLRNYLKYIGLTEGKFYTVVIRFSSNDFDYFDFSSNHSAAFMLGSIRYMQRFDDDCAFINHFGWVHDRDPNIFDELKNISIGIPFSSEFKSLVVPTGLSDKINEFNFGKTEVIDTTKRPVYEKLVSSLRSRDVQEQRLALISRQVRGLEILKKTIPTWYAISDLVADKKPKSEQ